MAEKVWRVREVAERLGVTVETVLARLHEGSLKGFRVGRAWRITDEALQEFMQRPPEPRVQEAPQEGETPKDNPLAMIDAELDPGICDKMTLMEKIEGLVQQASPPKPIEA